MVGSRRFRSCAIGLMVVRTESIPSPKEAVMPRVVWNGPPGSIWHNDTGHVAYQFRCSFQNTCWTCFQNHGAISPSLWPLPFHRNCQCHQLLIKPGEDGFAFVDYRKVLDDLPPGQQSEAIGDSNYKLLKAGKVEWTDIVTSSRIVTGSQVRTFQEVVSRVKLTVEEMEAYGIEKDIAEQVYGSVHNPQHELLATRRRVLIDPLSRARVSEVEIKIRFRKAMAKRLSNDGGPSGQPET